MTNFYSFNHNLSKRDMNWQEICTNPVFNTLPFKVETNKWGKIEMSPLNYAHDVYQALLMESLNNTPQPGRPFAKCSIQTVDGIKIADVAWGSDAFFKNTQADNPYLTSPEIVIEISTAATTRAEMNYKKRLYFTQGAREFWVCDKHGCMSFWNPKTPLTASELVPDFPVLIRLEFN